MKKDKSIETDINPEEFPDNIVRLLNETINTKSYKEKVVARKKLVHMGKSILPDLHKLLLTKTIALRMEVAKVVQLIGSRRSISALIEILDDPEFDIRWIAAEGLIKIGRKSIIPLLESVRDGKSSLIMDKGTHHILQSLLTEKEKITLKPLLQSLDNFHEMREITPTQAAVALKTTFKSRIP